MCIRDSHKPAAADDVAVTEVDTEVVVSDEMIDVAVDRAMLDRCV